jgi:Na+/melibiose symporter-like transporter
MSSTRADYVTIPEGEFGDDDILNGDEGLGHDSKESQAKDIDWLKPSGDLPHEIIEGIPNDKLVMGIGYMLAMGVCGIVLVALGSTLEALAANVGKTATEIGTVFITRGIGAILGAISSAKLYQWFAGNYIMFGGLFFITILLIALPFVRSDVLLHFFFLFLGLGTAVTDTGCQIMTRKLHGKAAGPWLGK